MTENDADDRRGGLSSALKALWLIAVIGTVLWYTASNGAEIAGLVRQLSVSALVLSVAWLFLAKCLISLMIQRTLTRTDTALGYRRVFHIYNATQAAKYIPGSVWHFLGRVALYRKLGMRPGQISKAMLVENMWLVTGAVVTACLFLSGAYIVSDSHPWLAPVAQLIQASEIYIAIAVLGAFLGLATALWLARPLLIKIISAGWPGPVDLGLMVAIHATLGLSLYALVVAMEPGTPIVYVIAVSAAATGLGHLALFAPAGLGVKDVGLVVLLAPYMDAETAFVAVAVHRLIYIALDLVLSAVSGALLDGDKVSAASARSN